MHISYKPLWHTLIERNMRKEDLRLAAGLTTNMIVNMGKEGKHISMDTLYGRLHREYLKQEHPEQYSSLILTGKLWTYLADLNEQAEERLDLIMGQMKAAERVTEELKARNQLEWVGRMNNIRSRAEEIIKSEMIYI